MGRGEGHAESDGSTYHRNLGHLGPRRYGCSGLGSQSGVIGGGMDVVSTSIIAKNAIRMFMQGENPDDTMPTEAEIEDIEDIEVESDLL